MRDAPPRAAESARGAGEVRQSVSAPGPRRSSDRSLHLQTGLRAYQVDRMAFCSVVGFVSTEQNVSQNTESTSTAKTYRKTLSKN